MIAADSFFARLAVYGEVVAQRGPPADDWLYM
jgi:hypothetical protein